MSQPSPGQVSITAGGNSSTASYDQSVPAATVVVGEVQIDDNNAQTVEESALNNAIFDEFIINSRFEGDGHRYMLGITSETGFQGSSVAFVQLASPTLLWIADWTVLVKATMRIPDPDVPIQDWVLLDDHVESVAVVPNPDGITPLYRISGTYVYGHKNPKAKTYENVTIPRLPWVKDGVFQTTILSSNLDNTLLIPGGGGGNGSTPPAPNIKAPNTNPPNIKTI